MGVAASKQGKRNRERRMTGREGGRGEGARDRARRNTGNMCIDRCSKDDENQKDKNEIHNRKITKKQTYVCVWVPCVRVVSLRPSSFSTKLQRGSKRE